MEPPKIWRERRDRYNGLGSECGKCKSKYFPPIKNCPKCNNEDMKVYQIARTGRVIHFTSVTQTADEIMHSTPHLVGLIELDDGIRITGQIVDCNINEIKEGLKVRMVFRVLARNGREGLIRYGFKFSPIEI